MLYKFSGPPQRDTEAFPVSPMSDSNRHSISRRDFMKAALVTPAAGFLQKIDSSKGPLYLAIVNHWHHSGVGFLFREGDVAKKHYSEAYSIFYSIQKTMDALDRWPSAAICLEFDSYAYEKIFEEDPEFVRNKMQQYVNQGRIDIVGGTYTQPYSQLVGWQSNIRQLVEGRAVVRNVFGKEVDLFLVEEIIFHPQMPQLLKLSGFRHASLQSHNNGTTREIREPVIQWRGLDGTTVDTIPNNELMISLLKQNQTFEKELVPARQFNTPLLTLWAEVWPPGLDWGGSYLAYEKGVQALQAEGVQLIGISEYMNKRCKPGEQFPSEYIRLDDATFTFGWPQNQGMLWEKMGGWGFQGDFLMKEDRRLESKLKALEQLLSIAPLPNLNKKVEDLWKKLMITQNHDFFIVADYPMQYKKVNTSMLEVAAMMYREIDAEVAEVRRTIYSSLLPSSSRKSEQILVCQNPTGQQDKQPIVFDAPMDAKSTFSCHGGSQEFEVQRIEPQYLNENPKFVILASLPPYGLKTFRLTQKPHAVPGQSPKSKEVTNEFYAVRWESKNSAFSIQDLQSGTTLLFRPFSGDIRRVNETLWPAPNTGENFRAKNFQEITYNTAVEASGPLCHSLFAGGNILTLATTEYPAAWVVARAKLYQGIKRIDICTELHTYPQMAYLALAELEVPFEPVTVHRDFPFGEEQSDKDQFTALHYVRLETPKEAIVLAHAGTQQFFKKNEQGHTILRNMIARETHKGSFRWHWSLKTGGSFSTSESYLLAESLLGAVAELAEGTSQISRSLVSTDDPAVAIFRIDRSPKQTTLWLSNFSAEKRSSTLTLSDPMTTVRRVDFEGKPVPDKPAPKLQGAKNIGLSLSPWEMMALELNHE